MIVLLKIRIAVMDGVVIGEGSTSALPGATEPDIAIAKDIHNHVIAYVRDSKQ